MRVRHSTGSAVWSGCVFVLLCLVGLEAQAALGSAPTAPVSQALTLKRALATTTGVSTPYSQYERVLSSGTTVREYSRADGLVFAVSWEGPVLPDLNELLGTYFATFMDGVKQDGQSAGRGSPLQISRDGLVVRSNGRMRNFFGHAYVPALVPIGVEITDVLR
jgi:hypothetical protein